MTKTGKKIKKPDKSKESFYINENVLNYDFSDFVKINSSPRGLIFAFGNWCPEKKKFGIFKEILLPFDVAEALSKIINNQMKELEDLNLIEKVKRSVPEKEIEEK